MTILAIIYIVGLSIAAALAFAFSTDRHWVERLGTVAMCLLWFIVVGACILMIIGNAWTALAYRKRGEATGDWRP